MFKAGEQRVANMPETQYHMLEFQIHDEDNGFFEINVPDFFKDAEVKYLTGYLQELYASHHARYICIDLSQHHILPIRVLGLAVLRFYRESVYKSPMYIGLVVQPSIAQVLGSVLKTLMRRELVQTFTDLEKAKQWLCLEKELWDNHSR